MTAAGRPTPGAVSSVARLTRFMRWLEARARPPVRRLRSRSGAGRSRISRASGARSGSFGIRASVPPARAGAARCPARNGSPGARLNYAENVLSSRAAAATRTGLPVRARPAGRPVLGRARARGASAGDALRALGIGQGRPRGRLPAEHARSDRRDARDDEHRRGLVELRTGFRRARRARSLFAARAEADVLRRRLQLRRQALRPARGYARDHRRAADARARRARCRISTRTIARRSRPARCSGTDCSPAPIPAATFEFEQVPFAHPLWILFSSGRPGCPSRSCTATAASRSSS